ncbi:MAG: amidohydrolase family protein [Balneolaceae bacterium]|nr:amidohydrolase family protein [Balneolaceae bacterium]
MGICKTLITHLIIILAFSAIGCIEKEPTNNFVPNHTDYDPVEGLPDSLHAFLKYKTGTIAFTNATLIDGTGGNLKVNQTVVVNNGVFEAIGSDSSITIPENTKVINLKGKTMIPGIIGMHNHLHIPGFPFVGDIASKLYLASGVTTIQTAGAAIPHLEVDLSKRITAGKQIGPEIITSAPFITGKGGNPNMIIPKNEEHLRDTLQHWIKQGVNWIKVYRNTHPNDLEIIIDEAHKNNVKVRGHLCSITFEEATKMGIDGIEHGLNSASDFRTNKEFGLCSGGREYIDQLDLNSPKVKKLQQLMIYNQVFLTSTLSIYEASVPNRAYADQRTQNMMSPYLLNQYTERRVRFNQIKDDLTREKRLKQIMQFEYQFFKMGGLLCSGVDAGRHVLPGFGDQRNFELFIEAGFSTEEAIQVMTGNGAKALGREDIGIIKAGRRADFVILDGDLRVDPSTIEKVETVFKKGIGYDPQKILSDINGSFGL